VRNGCRVGRAPERRGACRTERIATRAVSPSARTRRQSQSCPARIRAAFYPPAIGVSISYLPRPALKCQNGWQRAACPAAPSLTAYIPEGPFKCYPPLWGRGCSADKEKGPPPCIPRLRDRKRTLIRSRERYRYLYPLGQPSCDAVPGAACETSTSFHVGVPICFASRPAHSNSRHYTCGPYNCQPPLRLVRLFAACRAPVAYIRSSWNSSSSSNTASLRRRRPPERQHIGENGWFSGWGPILNARPAFSSQSQERSRLRNSPARQEARRHHVRVFGFSRAAARRDTAPDERTRGQSQVAYRQRFTRLDSGARGSGAGGP